MSVTACPNCGLAYQPGARFCRACGTLLETAGAVPTQAFSPSPAQSAGPTPGVAACPACGRPVKPGVQFCPACGAPQPTGSPASPATQNVGFPPPAPTAAATQLLSPAVQPPAAGLPTQLVPQEAQPVIPPTQTAAPPAQPPRNWRYLALHGGLVASMAACLIISLAAILVFDLTRPAIKPTPIVTPFTVSASLLPTAKPDQRVIKISLGPTGRFGVYTNGPQLPASVRNKFLTFSPTGDTSNTRIWLDGNTPIFGEGGKLTSLATQGGVDRLVWENGPLVVTQTLDYVIGPSGQGDTVRIQYDLANRDKIPHQVGMRVLIDTLIGNNDGVPFVIPGQEGMVDKAIDLGPGSLPDTIRALEKPDLSDPGVIINVRTKGAGATPPDRAVISTWYGKDMDWEFLPQAGGPGAFLRRDGKPEGQPDSVIGLYYNPQTLAPGAARRVVSYYGLGNLSSSASGNKKLGLFAPGNVHEGDLFYITAVVAQPQPGETLRLQLPDGLVLDKKEKAEKAVPFGNTDFTQVSWLVQACKAGEKLKIETSLSPGSIKEAILLKVEALGITRPGGACP